MLTQPVNAREEMLRRFITAFFFASFAAASTALGAAGLNDAVVRWDMATLDDTNGDNSPLAIVDAGDGSLIGVGVNGFGFWSGEGAGSDDVYANQRTGTSRIGTYFDAGQGTNNELQVTGAHTILWRGEFKDVSITGYLWNKYDHAVGPNGLKNRGAFVRYEPGGDLRYEIDDGDATGGNGVSVMLPDGTVGTGGAKYEVIAVFDPVGNQASLYVLDPNPRTVLTSATASVTFDTLDMATPVPFTLGDRLTWNGSAWQSIGGSGTRVDTEMFVVWDRAYSEQDLLDLAIDAPPEPVDITNVVVDPAIMIEFNSVNGENYELEFTASPADTNWLSAGFTIRGDGTTRQAFDPAGFSTQKTYRVINP